MEECRYSKIPELYFGEIEDGQIVLRDESNRKTHVMNTSAAEIWDMCVNMTKKDLVESYLLNYEFKNKNDQDEARTALQNTVELLIQEGLIKCVTKEE